MSGPVAEALNPMRENCPQQPCTCSFLGEKLCPYYARLLEIKHELG